MIKLLIVSLNADYEECLVEVKQLGVNPSGLDGFALKKNGVYKVGHDHRIELLLNQYIHVIEFDPPPEGYEKPKPSHKRKLDEDETSDRKMKALKTEFGREMASVAKENMKNTWEDVDKGELYVFTSKGVTSSHKIAAFDMDGTLIKTKSGKVHPVDTNDWQIAFPQVGQKLKDLLKEGFKLVILSNQAPIGNGRVKIEDFKKKIENIVEKLSVPVQAYIATGKGFYRKPTTGMWQVLSEKVRFILELKNE